MRPVALLPVVVVHLCGKCQGEGVPLGCTRVMPGGGAAVGWGTGSVDEFTWDWGAGSHSRL